MRRSSTAGRGCRSKADAPRCWWKNARVLWNTCSARLAHAVTG